jgi:hypothetical protein
MDRAFAEQYLSLADQNTEMGKEYASFYQDITNATDAFVAHNSATMFNWANTNIGQTASNQPKPSVSSPDYNALTGGNPVNTIQRAGAPHIPQAALGMDYTQGGLTNLHPGEMVANPSLAQWLRKSGISNNGPLPTSMGNSNPVTVHINIGTVGDVVSTDDLNKMKDQAVEGALQGFNQAYKMAYSRLQ